MQFFWTNVTNPINIERIFFQYYFLSKEKTFRYFFFWSVISIEVMEIDWDFFRQLWLFHALDDFSGVSLITDAIIGGNVEKSVKKWDTCS